MTYESKELLLGYRLNIARKASIQAALKKLWTQERMEEKIAEMTFGSRRLDGMPRAPGIGRRTEQIALNYREIVTREIAEELERLEEELDELERVLENYQMAVGSLTERERALVRLHYDERVPIKEIAEKRMPLYAAYAYSESTLKRMNREILQKVQRVLGWQAENERESVVL